MYFSESYESTFHCWYNHRTNKAKWSFLHILWDMLYPQVIFEKATQILPTWTVMSPRYIYIHQENGSSVAYWLIVNWTVRRKPQWHFISKGMKIFFEKKIINLHLQMAVIWPELNILSGQCNHLALTRSWHRPQIHRFPGAVDILQHKPFIGLSGQYKAFRTIYV